MLKRLLRRLPLNPEVLQVWKDCLIPSSFGQLGEDAVIDNHLSWLGLPAYAPGMYLDIGAHHPTRGSNTYRFYRRGAKGIAVDIGECKRQLWQRVRPRDRFINAAVVPSSWIGDKVEFHLSNGYGSATDHVSGYGVVKDSCSSSTLIPSLRAGDLSEELAATTEWIAAPWRLLNIDIEGLDEGVLHDLNLDVLIPDVVAIESFLPIDISIWRKMNWIIQESSIVKSMESNGYSLQSICGPTLLFVRLASYKQILRSVSNT